MLGFDSRSADSSEHDSELSGHGESGEGRGESTESSSSPVNGQNGSAEEGSSEPVEHDLEQLVAKASERDDYLALAQRTQADFDNYRKRVARESATAESRGIGKVVRHLLPALDSLDRAVESIADGESGSTGEASDTNELASGLRLVRDELHSALAKVGVESFSPQGEQFDPEYHEAMAKQPAEGVESGHVCVVYQCGYRLDGTVLRPARVVVAE